jgi:hypothetical protein
VTSYDAGERLRITVDANGALRVSHGAREIATIKSVIGGAIKVEADGRTWRLTETANGWFGAGDPSATMVRRSLRSDVLRIGDDEYKVSGRTVKGLLKLTVDKSGHKPAVTGELLGSPRTDGHATVALATAAVVLGVDLSMGAAHSTINGDNISSAVRYGVGMGH